MARTDAIVLGAGIVGTSIALQLVKRGLSVGMVDLQSPGLGTSYGNAGVDHLRNESSHGATCGRNERW